MAATPPRTLTKKELKVLLATAKTAADHQKIASYYRGEAERLAAKARYHEEMAAQYLNSPLPFEGKFPYGTIGLSHCRQWTQTYKAKAQEAESLALLHEEMAQAVEQNR
jgi:hypothetical protein